jgi:hypothetical protein
MGLDCFRNNVLVFFFLSALLAVLWISLSGLAFTAYTVLVVFILAIRHSKAAT